MWRYVHSHQNQFNLGCPNSHKAPCETFAIFSKDQKKAGTASGTNGRVWLGQGVASGLTCVAGVYDLLVWGTAGSSQRWCGCKLSTTLQNWGSWRACDTSAQAGMSTAEGAGALGWGGKRRKSTSTNVCFLLCGFGAGAGGRVVLICLFVFLSQHTNQQSKLFLNW